MTLITTNHITRSPQREFAPLHLSALLRRIVRRMQLPARRKSCDGRLTRLPAPGTPSSISPSTDAALRLALKSGASAGNF